MPDLIVLAIEHTIYNSSDKYDLWIYIHIYKIKCDSFPVDSPPLFLTQATKATLVAVLARLEGLHEFSWSNLASEHSLSTYSHLFIDSLMIRYS